VAEAALIAVCETAAYRADSQICRAKKRTDKRIGRQEKEEGVAFVITGEVARCAVDERVAVGVQFAEV